jgi:hypothetical protein
MNQDLLKIGTIVQHKYQIYQVTSHGRPHNVDYNYGEQITDGRSNVLKNPKSCIVPSYSFKILDREAIEKMYQDSVSKAEKLRAFLLSKLKED